MKTYKITLTKRVRKTLKTLEPDTRARISGAIELLKLDPIPPSSKRLVGTSNYRLRIGDHRIIYRIESGQLLILILTIDHRRDAYRYRG